MATSFFSENSYYFKRILSKINKFSLIWIQDIVFFVLVTTVKPVLSGHRIKRTPSIKRIVTLFTRGFPRVRREFSVLA